MRAGIALGANLGDRLASLTTARERIFSLPDIHRPLLSSSLYETEPVECEPGAARFLNAVIEIGYEKDSANLLRSLRQIETELGRPKAHGRNRSRAIDLDLLYHGARVRDDPELQLPHPRIQVRRFVLLPLAEIRPNLVLPGQSKTIRELNQELADAPSVVRWVQQW